jgi:hypothetical protein
MSDFFKKLAVGASSSSAFKIDFTDLKKMFVNALLVGAATTVLYVSGHLSSADFGVYTPIIVPVLAGALDAVYRFLKDNTTSEDKPEEKK